MRRLPILDPQLGAAVVKPLTRVLPAVDFSEPAWAAFDHALVLSRTHNAELTVVHAVQLTGHLARTSRKVHATVHGANPWHR
jgi:hypothetical protein